MAVNENKKEIDVAAVVSGVIIGLTEMDTDFAELGMELQRGCAALAELSMQLSMKLDKYKNFVNKG